MRESEVVARRCSRAVVVAGLSLGVAGGLATPLGPVAAQAFDSTAMPSLELLALEAGRASRRHPIRVVSPTLLCEPHPLVDSASLAACVALPLDRAAAVAAAFARGIELSLAAGGEGDVALPACPVDVDRAGTPRVMVARLTAPVVGVYEGRWEGRLLVELRCRSPGAGPDGVRIMGKEYLYQWSGRAWEMYQHSWLHATQE